jgi:hypothetical protein
MRAAVSTMDHAARASLAAAPPLVAAAILFAAWPATARAAAVPGALACVALALLLAVAASGGASPVAMASGAVGAFAAGLLSPTATAFGGAVVVAAAYAERTTRVHGRAARVAHVALAVVGGAIAGGLAGAFASSPLGLRAVAVVVAAVLASLPRLVDADDLVAHALDAIARDVDEPAAGALVAGADLRRHADDALLDRPTARTARRTWRALLRLAEARLRVQRARKVRATSHGRADASPSPADAVLAMLDGKLTDHVAGLARAYAAVDTARAAELGLDDAALRTVESAGETLEQVSRAMIDAEP